MKIAVLACVVAVALAMPSSDQEWEEYKAKYGKNYESNDEESVRRDNYYKSKELVEKHNELYNQGLESYTLVLNRFADMTPAEVAKKMNGLIPSDSNIEGELHEASNNSLPASVDWRTKGVVTPVKDQQDCGGCWAFSSTGSLEAHWALAKGKLVSLSEQNLIDCSQDEGNNGCDGGLMTNAFEYIKKNHGVDSESSYPFADETETCSFDKKNVAATLSSWKNIAQGSEANLQDAVATKGPVSVGIDARGNNFHLYGGGIYNSQQCSSIKLDHAVLVVGYGTENGKDYWLVKNSWGTGWGEDGYIRMTRNGNNQCGIASLATYPIV